MAADEFVNHVLDMLGSIGEVEAARFFGGNAIRLAGVQFAMIQGAHCTLLLVMRFESNSALGSQPFSYDTRHGLKEVQRYYRCLRSCWKILRHCVAPAMQRLLMHERHPRAPSVNAHSATKLSVFVTSSP